MIKLSALSGAMPDRFKFKTLHIMKKITKRDAIKGYNSGLDIIVTPSKMSPESFMAITVNVKEDCEDFEKLLNRFRYYNCSKETGMGVHFYKK